MTLHRNKECRFLYFCRPKYNIKLNFTTMKKYLHLFLFILVFAGFANAQGIQSTANWFGYISPPSPAEYKYVTFTMQDLWSASIASDEIPSVSTATFADGYVWSVNNVYGYAHLLLGNRSISLKDGIHILLDGVHFGCQFRIGITEILQGGWTLL